MYQASACWFRDNNSFHYRFVDTYFAVYATQINVSVYQTVLERLLFCRLCRKAAAFKPDFSTSPVEVCGQKNDEIVSN